MTNKKEVYKCEQCGPTITVLIGGKADLSCCESKMVEVTPTEAKKFIYDLSRPGAP
jgi:desulfoferrodoxin-like iron-binding protein